MDVDITQLVAQLGLGGMVLFLVVMKLKDIEDRIKELNETIRELILKQDLK